MPELQNRDAVEAALSKALGRAGTRAARLVQDALGDNPDANALTNEVWNAVASEYQNALMGALEQIFIDGAQGQMDAVGVPVDFDVVNQAAADFARNNTYEQVRKLTDNSRRVLQSALSDYFENRLTLRDLQARITRTFGPVRASHIAVTETTRAAAEGERAVNEALRNQGVHTRNIVETSDDDRVCVICGPLDGTELAEGQAWPPFHIGCRCWVRSEVVTE